MMNTTSEIVLVIITMINCYLWYQLYKCTYK
uniref:Uncharacterized protein n=1 Tax=Anguilla anguilla TaxID=7936 RepID=A0A0E9T1W6_ANGAN